MTNTKKRLIDPTEYKSFLERYIKDFYEIDAPMIAGAIERCLQKLECQPSVDAVEVVRCKDCQWYAPNNKGYWFGCAFDITCKEDEPKPDDFCPYGEKMIGGNDNA